ncbi:cytochrome c3 family protein [Ferrimonas lipolytica]|uniref:Cytochrome c3 family protein n=1 Tax=Ferrimonas lipolytica TaxID=2724191 RepID=A0A6H1UET5_9GAMM|nr:cytochrome c3 family protein [Ferrimonas lipolytica]QIZ77605.1 cytochrome c3 family protein [Ferrimonas lipolytica]
MKKTLVSLVLITVFATPVVVANPIKSHHQEIMSENGKVDCTICHDSQKDFNVPSEDACIACHGSKADLAEATARDSHDHTVEPNPHDSLHYGQDLACSYCHAEHQKSEIYCNHCHEFEYPAMIR